MDNNNRSFISKIINIKTIIIMIIIVGIIIIIPKKKDNVDPTPKVLVYSEIENDLVEKARTYVQNNGIQSNKEIYIDVNKMNYPLDNRCSIASGVIYDGINYTPYLWCEEYKSNINLNTNPSITLNGGELIILAQGIKYNEPGYTCANEVIIEGTVGETEGVYNLFYQDTYNKSFTTRKIIIINNSELSKLYPNIQLIGNYMETIKKGEQYTDNKSIADDVNDGNISYNIHEIDNINTNKIGEYYISYSITNSKGYTNFVQRKVRVVDQGNNTNILTYSYDDNNENNRKITIHLYNFSENFDYYLFPDETKSYDRKADYSFVENKEYVIKLVEKNGQEYSETITIDTIKNKLNKTTCSATLHNDYSEVKVEVPNNVKVVTYEYIFNGNREASINSPNYKTNTTKPNKVSVKVIDDLGVEYQTNCKIDDQTDPKITTDSKGKNCIEGYVCYVQFDFSNSSKYPYCSMSNNPNTCGGIGRNGCSITSLSIAVSGLPVRSKSGGVHTPYTIWEEAYPINKKTGQCGGGCSAWTRIRDGARNAGLSTPDKVTNLNNSTIPLIEEHLKKGYPIIVHASGPGPFVASKGHYLTLIAINKQGLVFLSDPANTSGTFKKKYNGKSYYVDTWIPINDLITGYVDSFLRVGPKGLF